MATKATKGINATVPYGYAKSRGVLVEQEGEDVCLLLARKNAAPDAIFEVARRIGVPFRMMTAAADEFDERLAMAYRDAPDSAARLAADLAEHADLARMMEGIPETADLLDAEDNAPVIRMINALFSEALKGGASDIHIEPYETRSVVRFRRDGVLQDIASPHRALHAALVSRIKIMAQMDISEKRLPQDGRINLRLAGRPVDVRVSTLPTGHGERVVMRLLNKDAGQLDLGSLGMADTVRAQVDQLIAKPHGIFLVTGPTGSGKTTTLYAALSRLDTKSLNIMTVEDPIEYDLEGIGQTQVNARIDLSFSRALRSILRQDPDVIMIGEIRDLETAQIAVQASLTGHLVLATLHTNDSVAAVTRLTDMGIEPYLLASSLLGIMAQRLVRCLCPDCRQPYAPSREELAAFPAKCAPKQLFRPGGCESCGGTGYLGRTGIYELFVLDDAGRQRIHDQSPEQALREYATQSGMVPLRSDGLRWVATGTTSIDELARVTRD